MFVHQSHRVHIRHSVTAIIYTHKQTNTHTGLDDTCSTINSHASNKALNVNQVCSQPLLFFWGDGNFGVQGIVGRGSHMANETR